MANTNLIKLYGEFWNPDIVDWGARGRGKGAQLLGQLKKDNKSYSANFFEAQGIYILYDSFKAVYVGKAFSTSIGKRVRDHLTDRHAGRWDMFSWYSTCSFKITDSTLRKAGQRQLSPETIINTLEALSILIADPAMNRKRERLPDAIEVTQKNNPNPTTIRSYLETILDRLPQKSGDT